MTTIFAFRHKDKKILVADKQLTVSSGYKFQLPEDKSKVNWFPNSKVLIGASGDPTIQKIFDTFSSVLDNKMLEVEGSKTWTLDVTAILMSVIEAEWPNMTKEKNSVFNDNFLVLSKDIMFKVWGSQWVPFEVKRPFLACGSGGDFAEGALHLLKDKLDKLEPLELGTRILLGSHDMDDGTGKDHSIHVLGPEGLEEVLHVTY